MLNNVNHTSASSTRPIDGRISNMLTFDIEEWFHANYDNMAPDTSKGSNFRAHMDELLQLCSDTGCKATFFVLGCIGEKYPDIVQRIAKEGHDVASHGYGHELAYKQTYDEFKADVKKSVDILEALTGAPVLGYRAPSWSIVERNLHYLEALEELGMQYDASIFPVKTFLYGIPTAPTVIHKPQVNGRELGIYEVPMSVMNVSGKNVGYSGGFYFRFFPKFVIKSAIRSANRQGKSSIVYLHPREIDAREHKLELPLKEHFIHYYNVRGTKSKLEDIMKSFRFTSISEHLKLHYEGNTSIS
ncbi:polysaccharide deacetylase family protein [Paenibacillus sp. OAS669]|uniref:polysaccharide deacetylase family protein n=1 Tax=Paenibacillus sp. OAS669 TaxID=2663821 RepID=UPI00178B3600|nr:polysaccharide deacetylase family protein [Paenibacillus sp. OAS669]MBE1447368.1 polysaccharide deacetylase family protein (PEP-CTERM system associated) [Paenibacillus sp. OAS669]